MSGQLRMWPWTISLSASPAFFQQPRCIIRPSKKVQSGVVQSLPPADMLLTGGDQEAETDRRSVVDGL